MTGTSGPVIAAVDGRERSADAVSLARALATALATSAAVANVYVTPPLAGGALGDEVRALQREDALRVVAAAAGGEPALETHVTGSGSPGRGLVELAEQLGAAAIVMGSSHRGALGRVLPGSAGERLLHGAPCPVAVAPAGYADEHPQGDSISMLAVAYDGTPEADRALGWAAAIAAGSGARMLLVHAVAPTAPKSNRELYAEFTRYVHDWAARQLERGTRQLPPGIASETRVVEGDAAEAIAAEAARAGADLVVAGSRGHGPVARVLLGGVGAWLVRHADRPVAIVPRAEDR